MENLKNVAPIEDFNWDAYENGETVTNVSHDELEKAYDGTLNKVNDREVVDGTVIAMNKREVVVNIGYKSDGIIPLNEFRYNPDLKIGDTVEVYIENQEDKKGQLVLSHRKARATRSWDRVNAALENEEIIKGYIIVADRFNVDLRTRQECFDSEYVYDHTTLSAALDVTLDNFFIFQSSVHAIPRTSSAGFSV